MLEADGIAHLAPIVTEAEFVQVHVQAMLGNLMKSPVEGPLHDGPDAFNRVGVNVYFALSSRPFPGLVDHLPMVELLPKSGVVGGVITENLGPVVDV